jgi:hypothetical protein
LRGALGSGERVRPGYWDRFLGVATSDPRKAALGEMHDLSEKFRRRMGYAERGERFGKSPIATMRAAASDGDYEAFRDARRVYLANGGKYENFLKSIGNLDPIARLKGEEDAEGDTKTVKAADNLERRFVHNFLTAEQREKWAVSRDYARGLEVSLWKYWQDASEKDDAFDQRQAQRAATDKEIAGKVRLLGYKQPSKPDDRVEWNREADSALEWLRRHQIDPERAEAAFREHQKTKNPTARADALSRLRKHLREID